MLPCAMFRMRSTPNANVSPTATRNSQDANAIPSSRMMISRSMGVLRTLRARESPLDPVGDLHPVRRVHALHRKYLDVREAGEPQLRVHLRQPVHGLLHGLVTAADRHADGAARRVELRVLERLDHVLDA